MVLPSQKASSIPQQESSRIMDRAAALGQLGTGSYALESCRILTGESSNQIACQQLDAREKDD